MGKNNPNFEYFIGEGTDKIKLLPDNSEKDLGVYVDPKLSFDIHINETIKNVEVNLLWFWEILPLKIVTF